MKCTYCDQEFTFDQLTSPHCPLCKKYFYITYFDKDENYDRKYKSKIKKLYVDMHYGDDFFDKINNYDSTFHLIKYITKYSNKSNRLRKKIIEEIYKKQEYVTTTLSIYELIYTVSIYNLYKREFIRLHSTVYNTYYFTDTQVKFIKSICTVTSYDDDNYNIIELTGDRTDDIANTFIYSSNRFAYENIKQYLISKFYIDKKICKYDLPSDIGLLFEYILSYEKLYFDMKECLKKELEPERSNFREIMRQSEKLKYKHFSCRHFSLIRSVYKYCY